jgi:hypothetical protein
MGIGEGLLLFGFVIEVKSGMVVGDAPFLAWLGLVLMLLGAVLIVSFWRA